jgi:CheY-like chemotaxis protein
MNTEAHPREADGGVKNAIPEMRRTVLIVDDDADLRDVLRTELTSEGYVVLEAANGQEALAVLLDAPVEPSLILLDLSMPVMTGGQLLAVLRTHRRLAEIPVLVMAANVFDPQALSHTATMDYLVKPVHFDDLLSKLLWLTHA